ncbi:MULTISPECIES: enoyl-CoA hydratase/isomerase family protein [Gammaproteobacteria]|uniref:enoyl-CoA hydratase/isomerase family protein n=1 Tax=Gammaproteobacteria TaxID=1236 RepID=UPI000DD0AC35|nr:MULTISPECIES: enoyl-CoA hydratase/isomerase family protein [Gammaproteobacteria]RTE87378.1 enoyl-CoA hydratase/isomerase family protein [Aliidiomarina sp. B3213]TCZ92836.1 enoyl-CoA hydratase/isomerase family protein [Lysobacter sp. N42]
MNYVQLDIDENRIATLSMNRPEVHNAFDDEMIDNLRAALAQIRVRGDIRALVLCSEGKSFSAGADLNWMRSMAKKNYEENVQDAGNLGALMRELDELPCLTIARVQGAAFGGAVGLVACCDIGLGLERASFCLSEVKIGLIPAVISPYVTRAMGPRAARRYTLTAERFFAQEAKDCGLLHDIYASEEALNEGIQNILNHVSQNGPAAVAAGKKLIQDVTNAEINEALIAETARRIAEIRVSPEGQEGLSAFLEKRKPSWIESTDGN